MLGFLLQRLFYGLLSIIGASILIFLIARLSGDPAVLMLPVDATPQMVEEFRREMGLDRPLWRQYLTFAGNALQGDFGMSYRWDRPALELVLDRLPHTLQLAVAALLFSVLLSIPLGISSAVFRGSWIDKVGMVIAMLGQAMPNFWVALLMIMVFASWLGWLPAYGSGTLYHLIMPAIALGWYPVAAQTRIVRSAMLDVLDSDFIRMGRAVGVPERVLIWKYALRNAAIPLVTMLGVYFAAMLGGAFIVEVIFAWPGVGRTVVDAVFARDFPVVQAGVLFAAVMFVAAHLLVDLSYGVIDPRIRQNG